MTLTTHTSYNRTSGEFGLPTSTERAFYVKLTCRHRMLAELWGVISG